MHFFKTLSVVSALLASSQSLVSAIPEPATLDLVPRASCPVDRYSIVFLFKLFNCESIGRLNDGTTNTAVVNPPVNQCQSINEGFVNIMSATFFKFGSKSGTCTLHVFSDDQCKQEVKAPGANADNVCLTVPIQVGMGAVASLQSYAVYC